MVEIKVKGKIKLKIENDITFGYSYLKIIVTFRKPNSILKETLCQELEKYRGLFYLNEYTGSYDAFLEKCEFWLDKSRLRTVGKEMIQNYLKTEAKKQSENNKQSNILRKIKKINKEKVEIEVEI